MENPMKKWMIWGYHDFWKHPNSSFEFSDADPACPNVDSKCLCLHVEKNRKRSKNKEEDLCGRLTSILVESNTSIWFNFETTGTTTKIHISVVFSILCVVILCAFWNP